MAANEGRQGGGGSAPDERGSGFGPAEPAAGAADPGTERSGARGEGIGSGVGSAYSGAAAGSGVGGAGFGEDTRGAGEDRSLSERAHELGDRTRERARELTEEGRDRARDAAEQGRSRLADGMSRLSHRLEEGARSVEEQGGAAARAGGALHRASDALDSGADYLRTHDLPMIGDDVITQIRERPLLACGVALGAGFLLGSMRGGDEEDEHDRDEDERWERYVARLERRGRLKTRGRDREDEPAGFDRHDRGGRFAALRSRWDEDEDEDTDAEERGVRAQLGRAIIAGVGALLSRQIQSRIAGRRD